MRVRASALNRADLMQREGRYPSPHGAPADIPGLEFAGEVTSVGRSVRAWAAGDRVFGIVAGGAHAQLLVAHERAVARIPDSLSWREAGAVPEAFITAHDALVTQAGMRPGETVLIHAVSSGVGLAAVQLVRALGGIPFGTTRTGSKLEPARALGLEDGAALVEGPEALESEVRRWTGGRGVDVVLDLVGGPYVAASVQALAPRGRLVLIGSIGGRRAELDLGAVMSRRLTLRGTVLRARPIEEKILATLAFTREVVPWLAAGSIRPTIDCVYPLAGVAEAHERLAGNATVGKVVLDISEDAATG